MNRDTVIFSALLGVAVFIVLVISSYAMTVAVQGEARVGMRGFSGLTTVGSGWLQFLPQPGPMLLGVAGPWPVTAPHADHSPVGQPVVGWKHGSLMVGGADGVSLGLVSPPANHLTPTPKSSINGFEWVSTRHVETLLRNDIPIRQGYFNALTNEGMRTSVWTEGIRESIDGAPSGAESDGDLYVSMQTRTSTINNSASSGKIVLPLTLLTASSWTLAPLQPGGHPQAICSVSTVAGVTINTTLATNAEIDQVAQTLTVTSVLLPPQTEIGDARVITLWVHARVRFSKTTATLKDVHQWTFGEVL